jgi:alpha-glucosidase
MTGKLWWRDGVIYQIYPRSFSDANGDGIGDLRGIGTHLDDLVELGVDAIWISPIYPSPMADFGYDVSDYRGVDPIFGNLADFDALIVQAHAKGLRVILDFVPNHTSDRHPWFEASRSSRSDAHRDWYLWRDPATDGGPPNNWLSNFGGSAWTFDAGTGQYYCHLFLDRQPDLNWRHPAVREAMYEVMRFWLRRGVDGFRVDVIYHLIKDAEFRDNPLNPAYRPGIDPQAHRFDPLYMADRPEVQEIVAQMRAVVDEFPERVLIGEIYLPLERLMAYYGARLEGANLPFNFLLIGATWNARAIAGIVREYEAALPLGGWPNWVLGNHDKSRIATRVGDAQARIAAVLLLTLRGTPTMYYGDEIGMHDVAIPADEVQDPFERNEPGKGLGRDPQRTPFPWNGAAGAGFTTARPWLRFGNDVALRNLAVQREDPYSLWTLYRDMLAIRRASVALTAGSFRLTHESDAVLVYERSGEGETVLVALNFSADEAPLPEHAARAGDDLLLSTIGAPGVGDAERLRPAEARVWRRRG